MSISRLRTLVSALSLFNQEHGNDSNIDDLTQMLHEEIQSLDEMRIDSLNQLTKLREKLAAEEQKVKDLKQILRDHDALFGQLEEAATPQSVIDEDTATVGEFVSTLNLTRTEGEIVDKACALLRDFMGKQ